MRTAPLWLLLVGCSGARPGPGPGGPTLADRDGDGWSPAEGDCDDRDPAVFPEAADPPGDGIDQDCDGGDQNPLRAVGLEPGDLLITEVMTDPFAVDADLGEWFEVQNRSAVPIDLLGLVIRDDDGEDATVHEPVVVDPDGAVVLGGWHEPEVNGGAPVDWSWGGELDLGNTQDELILARPDGTEIDAVRWDARFPTGEGRAMSLEPGADHLTNDEPESWCPAVPVYGLAGRGTPGVANPDCSAQPGIPLAQVVEGELVITEVLQNPIAADSDGAEWVEITNLSGSWVDLDGLVVRDDGGGQATVSGFLPLGPGEYAVFAGSPDPVENGGVQPDWSWEGAFGLGNGDDAVELAFGTRVFDRVAWDNGVSFPDPDGASMALDPGSTDALLNDDGAAWCTGTTPFGAGDLGSPGAANPACP